MPPRFHRNQITGSPNEYRPAVPLDDLVRTIRLNAVIQASVRLTAPWGSSMPEQDAVLIYFVLSGKCVAYTESMTDVVELSEGDALLLPTPCAHAMADTLMTPLVPLDKIIPEQLRSANSEDDFLCGLFSTNTDYGGGGDTTWIITLCLYLDKRFPSAILKTMPRLVRLRGIVARNQLFFSPLLHLIAAHGKRGFAGQSVATRLAESVLTVCVQDYLERDWQRSAKAYRGLSDPFLNKALAAINESPETNWSIAKLAEKAGMSRSAFINRFNSTMGQPPAGFITSLRMMRASELLENSDKSIAQIAHDVGYGSDASFSRAFFRWCGATPGTVRNRRTQNLGG